MRKEIVYITHFPWKIPNLIFRRNFASRISRRVEKEKDFFPSFFDFERETIEKEEEEENC